MMRGYDIELGPLLYNCVESLEHVEQWITLHISRSSTTTLQSCPDICLFINLLEVLWNANLQSTQIFNSDARIRLCFYEHPAVYQDLSYRPNDLASASDTDQVVYSHQHCQALSIIQPDATCFGSAIEIYCVEDSFSLAMYTAASDIRDRSQGLDSASHAALCFTDIPVSHSFSCNSSPPLDLDFFTPPQPDVGPTFLSPETFPSECWQPSPSPVPAIQATHITSDPYTDVSVGSTSIESSLSDVSACMPLPSSSMQQFYFSPVPLDNSIPQVPNQSPFPRYQPDKPTPQDPTSHLFLPHNSPTDFTSMPCSTTDDQFNPSPDQWLTLPTSTTTTSTATDYLISPSPSLPLSSPTISTTTTTSTTLSSSPTPSTLTLDYPQSQFHHTLPPTPTSLPRSNPHLHQNPPSKTTCPTTDLTNYGIPTNDGTGTWRCAHPGCTSSAIFRRGCDLRKHFNRHRKHLFCRHEGCPQSMQGGFSSKKDRARHEAKHNPGIRCEWEGCGRVFSRVDNMKDHVRRIHLRKRREGR